MSTTSGTVTEVFSVKLPSGFDPEEHTDALMQQFIKRYPGLSHDLRGIDMDSRTATIARKRLDTGVGVAPKRKTWV